MDALDETSARFDNLAPTALGERTWGAYAYAALWVGMAHSTTTYLLASAFISMGMSWIQALLPIALGNTIVLVPILLTGHAGAKYGIAFPVVARASYGTLGANVPALLRGVVAAGWFGIDCWIGAQALFSLIGIMWPHARTVWIFFGNPSTLWLSFLVFLGINLVIVWRDMHVLRRFEAWAAPVGIVLVGLLMVWIIAKAGGVGPIVSAPSAIGWGSQYFTLLAPTTMAMIAFWAPLSLNISDFTRFARSQKDQMIGQAIGLPGTMVLFPLMATLITSASVVVFGRPIWNPVELVGLLPSTAVRDRDVDVRGCLV